MPKLNKQIEITVSDGVNGIIYDSDNVINYRITGTETLTSNWAVVIQTISGGVATLVKGMKCIFTYDATVTLGGNHITILGTQMPDAYAAKETTIEAYYNGSKLVTLFYYLDKFNPVDPGWFTNNDNKIVKIAKNNCKENILVYQHNASKNPSSTGFELDLDCDVTKIAVKLFSPQNNSLYLGFEVPDEPDLYLFGGNFENKDNVNYIFYPRNLSKNYFVLANHIENTNKNISCINSNATLISFDSFDEIEAFFQWQKFGIRNNYSEVRFNFIPQANVCYNFTSKTPTINNQYPENIP